MLAAEKGARLRVAPVGNDGQMLLDEYEKLLGPRTRLVSISQVSNALGTITPVREMIASARRVGARVLLDGAQAVSHMPVDVQALDCDFYCFSGHKIFGPTGIGALYGKTEALDEMPPWQGGGNMIADVTFERTQYQPPPGRFEAGTGNIADAVGLAAALDYVTGIGLHNISALRARAARVRDRLPDRHPRAEAAAGPPGQGRRPVLRAGGPPADRGGRRAWTRRGSPFAPGTTARSRSCAASATKRRCARPWRRTTPATTSTRWQPRCGACRSGGRRRAAESFRSSPSLPWSSCSVTVRPL